MKPINNIVKNKKLPFIYCFIAVLKDGHTAAMILGKLWKAVLIDLYIMENYVPNFSHFLIKIRRKKKRKRNTTQFYCNPSLRLIASDV